jgi:hypothetical protein
MRLAASISPAPSARPLLEWSPRDHPSDRQKIVALSAMRLDDQAIAPQLMSPRSISACRCTPYDTALPLLCSSTTPTFG